MSDNGIYLLIKYIKSVLWRVAKRLSFIEDARCLKVKKVTVLQLNNKFLPFYDTHLFIIVPTKIRHLSS